MKEMTNFDKAFEELIGIEGGYVNDPTDRGGETKFGISSRSYPNVDIKNLTLEDAKKIYKNDYWCHNRVDLDNMQWEDNYPIQLEIFDTAVNMGSYTAAVMFQKSLNAMNRNEKNFSDLEIDGWIGNQTLWAYSKVDKSILLKVLNGYQFMRYDSIIDYDPSQERFFNGWMKRV